MIYSTLHRRSGKTVFWVRFWCRGGCGLHDEPARHAERAGLLRSQAVDLERRRVGEVAASTYRDARSPRAGGPTFNEFAERFLREYAALRRSDFYEKRVARLRLRFGPRLLRSITRADLDAYIARRGGEVKASTVRREAAVLSVMFKQAVRWDVLSASPAVGMSRPAEPGHRTRYLTPDEFRRLREAAPPWLRPILTLAVATCLRLKELANLRWEDWDRRAGVLVISPDRKIPTVHHVPVNTTARAVLDSLPVSTRDSSIFRPARGDAPIGSPRGRDRITRATIAAARAAGLDGVSFHTLRHTGASWMVQAGVPLYEVQRVLGHSTPVMTQRYAALAPGNLVNAAAALDAALGGGATAGPDPGKIVPPEASGEAPPASDTATGSRKRRST